MADETMGRINKLVPFLKQGARRAYVKGANLRVHVPTVKESEQLGQKTSFKSILGGYVDQVNTLQHDSDAQIQKLVAGETEDIHEVMLAMNEAETSFEMMMQIRNKLVEAYKELRSMSG